MDKYLVPKEMLTLGQELGEGYFGKVYKGVITNRNGSMMDVAIKTFKGKSYT